MNEKYIHRIFDVSIIFKGIIAVVETMGGFLVLFVTQHQVIWLVQAVTQDELTRDPDDFISNYLVAWAGQYSISYQHFIALYLLIHGIIKCALVFGLLSEKLWAYPSAIVVFSLFGLYQVFEYSHNHSVWLLILTVLDIFIIALTWHEYRYIKKIRANPPA